MKLKAWQIIFWPPVTELKYINSAIWMGCFAALFYAVIWGLIAIVGLIIGLINQSAETFKTTLEASIHLSIALLIGWGIYKKHKIASISGLGLSIIGFIGNWYTKGIMDSNVIKCFIMTWLFLHSTRGIFAYHGSNEQMELDENINKV